MIYIWYNMIWHNIETWYKMQTITGFSSYEKELTVQMVQESLNFFVSNAIKK